MACGRPLSRPAARTRSRICSNTDAPTTPRSRRSSTLVEGLLLARRDDLLRRSPVRCPGRVSSSDCPALLRSMRLVIVGRRLPGGPGVGPELGHQDLHPVGQRLREVDRPRRLGEVGARREPPGRGDRVTDAVSGLAACEGRAGGRHRTHPRRPSRPGRRRAAARSSRRVARPDRRRGRLIDRRGAARRAVDAPTTRTSTAAPTAPASPAAVASVATMSGLAARRGGRRRRAGPPDGRAAEGAGRCPARGRASGRATGPGRPASRRAPVRRGTAAGSGSAGRSAVGRRSGGPGSNGKTGRPTVRPRRTERTLGALRLCGGSSAWLHARFNRRRAPRAAAAPRSRAGRIDSSSYGGGKPQMRW